ncbi:MAG: hypothetical protein M3Z01_00585 [Thermoproteota archaeon]|nr:hypothetical protein [Thermoproteota archaeon]
MQIDSTIVEHALVYIWNIKVMFMARKINQRQNSILWGGKLEMVESEPKVLEEFSHIN